VIHKFSTILYISGFSFLVIALAPDRPNIISFCKRNDTTHHIHNIIRTIGNIANVILNHASNTFCVVEESVKNKDIITQNITNKSAGKRINNKTVFL
jgi:hypothetical protein